VLDLDGRATPVIREQNWTVFASPLADTIYKRQDSGGVAEHESGPGRRVVEERGTDGSSDLCGDTRYFASCSVPDLAHAEAWAQKSEPSHPALLHSLTYEIEKRKPC
jgi:hypothetical protein